MRDSALASSSIGRRVVDYKQYEEQLNSYQSSKAQKGNLAGLFDWSKPSQIVSLNDPPSPSHIPLPPHNQNRSDNTDQLLQSQGGGSVNSDSIDSDAIPSPPLTQSKKQSSLLNYTQIPPQYHSKTVSELQSELRDMRQQIISMNSMLNRKLDRYQILMLEQKKTPQQTPYQSLIKQIASNQQVLLSQKHQLKRLHELDQEYQKKDYLIQLGQLILSTQEQIHNVGKVKHERWVDVERIDRLLKEIDQLEGTQNQFRAVKELRKKLVFYFKKLQQQKGASEEMDYQIEQLQQKDAQATQRLEEMSRIAAQNNLEVRTNREFVDIKRRQTDQLSARDGMAKKKDSLIRAIRMNCDALQKECQMIRREVQRTEMQIQQIEYKSQTVEDSTQVVMKQHQILSTHLKPIAYRFDPTLISRPRFKTTRHSLTIDSHTDNAKVQSQQPEKGGSSSRVKPFLRQWKGMSERPRYGSISSKHAHATLQNSSLFKPPPIKRRR